MGIGNTTPSSAIASLITGRPVEDLTGREPGSMTQSFLKRLE